MILGLFHNDTDEYIIEGEGEVLPSTSCHTHTHIHTLLEDDEKDDLKN